MIRSFAAGGTEDVYHGRDTKAARRACPRPLWAVARRKLDQLHAAVSLNSLKIPPGNHLEALRGERAGQHSLRINDQFRICFEWTESGPRDVGIVDYH